MEREGEEGDEVRREERVYPRTGSQGDWGEDRGERHCRPRHRGHTLSRKRIVTCNRENLYEVHHHFLRLLYNVIHAVRVFKVALDTQCILASYVTISSRSSSVHSRWLTEILHLLEATEPREMDEGTSHST